ncbi:uncharacterized protein KGF55_004352 [Candida pseudojiufengensis]|uniref:uncharacterized protein n=1 Tax=Candida pseudojiufengensis TaxID=497109 RepID=UPI0022246489|nr:uncharacterized protein KGF55_004352 [Candida pseudojiufengensis]KAI5960782.1 hypothetical protein KGF55_004352 [Candida pseudojiufengensis]
MSSSIFNTGQEEEDPWSSSATNWDDNNLQKQQPYQSTYLTSSQLLNRDSSTPALTSSPIHNNNQSSIQTHSSLTNIPQSYETLHSELIDKISNINDFEFHILNKLVELEYLTSYQKSKLLDIIYDNDLLPVTNTSKFYQILGLIALEIDVPGSGDFVTLQFKSNSLPELPQKFLKLIEKSEKQNSKFDDPLMANTSRNQDDESDVDDWNNQSKVIDPILTDHSNTSIALNDEDNDNNDDGDNTKKTSPEDSQFVEKYIEDIRNEFKPLWSGEDLIKIKEVPEKEGLLFKHINYIIVHNLSLGTISSSAQKKVIRRYSDFAWLLEYLLEKYPFRVIPGLPPKKFTASPDSQFLQRRRRGLHRFLNQLIKHPVFKEEPIVQTFLTVPTDLTTWKKQAKIDYSLEFKGEKIQTQFINIIWPSISQNFLRNWSIAEQNIRFIIEKWTKIVIIIERHERRQQQQSYDNQKFVEILNQFKRLDYAIYPPPPINSNDQQEQSVSNTSQYLQNNDIEAINSNLSKIGEYYNKASQLIIDDNYLINTKTLEKFKNFMDYLYSLQELFERSKKLSVNQIDTLNKRIKENETRFKKLMEENSDIKGSEITKLRSVIINDKQEIFQQLNKDWLIKQCCFKEFIMFQETQFLITEIWQEWCKERFKFQEKVFNISDILNNEITGDMPLTR